jgi:hypothetical protein
MRLVSKLARWFRRRPPAPPPRWTRWGDSHVYLRNLTPEEIRENLEQPRLGRRDWLTHDSLGRPR